MTDSEKVDRYIERHSKWTDELRQLRAIFLRTSLKEEVKWGSPTYTFEGKLVAGMAAFKNHYAIWFHQGVFLKDPHKQLINAQEEVTKALRQWRFENGDPIPKEWVLEYIREATANAKAGKTMKPVRRKKLVLTTPLKEALTSDSSLGTAFNELTPGKQREYATYISEAKRVSTKQSRLEKIKPMIRDGIGLYDKYKDC